MRLSALVPAAALGLFLAAPAALADDPEDVNIASDLNVAILTAEPDNAAALGLDAGRQFGVRARYDGVPFQGPVPFTFSVDLTDLGAFAMWDVSASFGAGYWIGPVSLGVLGGLGVESGGKAPRTVPLLLTNNLQATAAVNLGDMFRLRVWAKPTWLWARIQGGPGDLAFSELTHTQSLLTIAGKPSDELALGAVLAFTFPRRGPSNQAFNGSHTIWVGAEYRAQLQNKMLGIFLGYGAATGAYNGPPLSNND